MKPSNKWLIIGFGLWAVALILGLVGLSIVSMLINLGAVYCFGIGLGYTMAHNAARKRSRELQMEHTYHTFPELDLREEVKH